MRLFGGSSKANKKNGCDTNICDGERSPMAQMRLTFTERCCKRACQHADRA